ncbi:MAG: transglutaminase family protein [Betaproteobacteria bacterium]|nr:transglutaminase family protein [Betaproteobacteria bacterium]
MLLHILHETRYDYRPAALNAHHLAYLRPLDGPQQQVLRHELRIDPTPDHQQLSRDLYDNQRLHFDLYRAHGHLHVRAETLVRTGLAQPALGPGPAWDEVARRYHYRVGAVCDAALEFAFASALAPRAKVFADFARPSFVPGRPLPEAAWDLMERLHRHMRYEPHSTEVDTPAAQALVQQRGVCQDFAHILIACCRSLGLPARYVSGYLLTDPPPGQARLIGSDASHAWASVYCPALSDRAEIDPSQPGQWLDLDPTNRRSPGQDYVTLAVGRDYADLSPLRGVIRGAIEHALSVAVTVTAWEDAVPAPKEVRPAS